MVRAPGDAGRSLERACVTRGESGLVPVSAETAQRPPPQIVLPLQQVATETGKAVAPVSARPQLVADCLLDKVQGGLQARTIQFVGAIAPPRGQRSIGLFPQCAGRVLPRPTIVLPSVQIADEMRLAQLPTVERQPVVDSVAVAANIDKKKFYSFASF